MLRNGTKCNNFHMLFPPPSVAITSLSWYDEDYRFAVGYSDGVVWMCSRDSFDPEPYKVIEAHKVCNRHTSTA